MGRTLTNTLNINFTVEEDVDDLGGLPASPIWKQIEPNSIDTFGAQITTVPRDPISRNRQRRKGSTTDLDSTFGNEVDLTLDSFEDFIRFYMYAEAQGPILNEATPNIMNLYIRPSAVTTSAYTIPAIAAAATERSLVIGKGFTNAANNGLKMVGSGSTTTSVAISGGGLTSETPTAIQNATLELCGFRFASGDLEMNSDGNLITTTKDFTELDLVAGQRIRIGGDATANQFAQTANNGTARVVSIAANLLTLDKPESTFVTDDGSGKEMDLYFGPFIKNVPTDDSLFMERALQFEGTFVNLDNPSGDIYRYSEGNYANTMAINVPLTDKATMSLNFVGSDTEPGTSTRATNADSPRQPVNTSSFNTSADIVRLRIAGLDDTGLTTDFKSTTITINNNVNPEKVLGVLGARYINYGNFEINIESSLLFTDVAIPQAIRDNTTQTMDIILKNDEGAISLDLPEVTLGDGANEYPVNESITISTTVQSHADTTYNASLMVTLFPFFPST